MEIEAITFERDLKRMRFKRSQLTAREDTTPEDWDALADEYEELEFMANAASCRGRANKLRERVVENA